MKSKSQSGFVVEAVLIVVLLAAVAGAGYFVWHKHQQSKPATTNSASASVASNNSSTDSTATPTAPQVNNASDLQSAMQALNQTDVTAGSSDSSQLSSQSNGF